MTEREEFCAWCGKRRPLRELLPLAMTSSKFEEARRWHCRRGLACHVRRIWKTRRIFFPDDD
jgi:hypothetical protein